MHKLKLAGRIVMLFCLSQILILFRPRAFSAAQERSSTASTHPKMSPTATAPFSGHRREANRQLVRAGIQLEPGLSAMEAGACITALKIMQFLCRR
jgi:hypothetical protein